MDDIDLTTTSAPSLSLPPSLPPFSLPLSPPPPPLPSPTPAALSDKGRGHYKCGRCGVPKRGHKCPYQPKLKRKPDEKPPPSREVGVQCEMEGSEGVMELGDLALQVRPSLVHAVLTLINSHARRGLRAATTRRALLTRRTCSRFRTTERCLSTRVKATSRTTPRCLLTRMMGCDVGGSREGGQ